jgi:hypothetical protein
LENSADVLPKTKHLMLALALAASFAGCGSDEESDSSAGASTATTAEGGGPQPKVSFVTPKDGSTSDGTVTAKVKLTDFELAPDAVGDAPRPGQGHLHFQMDEGRFDFEKYSGKNGKVAKMLGVEGKYSPAAVAAGITYRNLPPGKHTLEVYLANNNHTELPVEADVEITVK